MATLFRSFLCLGAVQVILLAAAPAHAQVPPASKPASLMKDADGAPLPEGVIARLGTLRFHHAGAECLTASPDGKLLASGSWQADGELRQGICLWDVASGKLVREIKLPKECVVRALAFSSDQSRLAAATSDGITYLFDTKSGKAIASWKTHKSICRSLHFSRDGKSLLLVEVIQSPVARDGQLVIRQWDVSTKKLQHSWQAHEKVIDRQEKRKVEKWYPVAVSPGGNMLAWSTKDSMRVMDVASGKELCRLAVDVSWDIPHEIDEFRDVALFSQDGHLLAVNATTGIYVFDTSTGKQFQKVASRGKLPNQGTYPRGSEYKPQLIAFSADGKILAARQDGVIKSWELTTGKLLGYQLPYCSAAITIANSSKIAILHQSVIRIFDMKTGAEQPIGPGHRSEPLVVQFAPDGKSLASACGERCVYWDTNAWKDTASYRWPAEVKTWSVHGGQPLDHQVAFFARRFTSQDTKGKGDVRIHDLKTAEIIRTIPTSKDYRLEGLSPEGSVAILFNHCDQGLTTRICDVAAGKMVAEWNAKSHRRPIAFSDNGKLVAWYNDEDQFLTIFRLPTGKPVQKIRLPGTDIAVTMSPDEKYVAVLWKGRLLESGHGHPWFIHIWSVATGKLVQSFDTKVTGPSGWDFGMGPDYLWRYGRLAFTPDNRAIALIVRPESTISGPVEGLRKYWPNTGVHLWEIATGTRRGILQPEHSLPTCMAIAPNGKYLANGSDDTTVLVWDLHRPLSGKQPFKLPLNKAALDTCWDALARQQASEADPAVWAMVNSPKESLPFLKERVSSAAIPKPALVKQWITDLGSDIHKVRQHATVEVEKVLYALLPALQEAAKKPPSVEVHLRLQQLIAKAQSTRLSAQQLRLVRAVEVLEHIGNHEARHLLQTLAQGAPAARLTQEAVMALDRLDRR